MTSHPSPGGISEPLVSVRRVQNAWRDADFCLHVEDVPAWLPSLDDEKKALASLSKAWPVLSKHADHIDGEFDLALTDVRSMLAAYRAEIAALCTLVRGASEDRAAKVTRFEVIDHRSGAEARGREFTAFDCRVSLSYQDDGRTLKAFVDDAARTPNQDSPNGRGTQKAADE